MKYNYVVYLTLGNGLKIKLDAPREVVDLSSPFADDRKKLKFTNPISRNKYLQNFSFLNNDLSYISYSITGHISDINDIIIKETSFRPWLDSKYIKRLYSLTIFYVFLFFAEKGINYVDKLSILGNIVNGLSQANGKNRMMPLKINHHMMQELYNHLSQINNDNINDPKLVDFLRASYNILYTLHDCFEQQYLLTRDQTFTMGEITGTVLDIQYPALY